MYDDNDIKIINIQSDFMKELTRAERIHPNWPTDVIRAAAILSEEAGEFVREANTFDVCEAGIENTQRERMRTEAIQVGTMAIRFLMHIDDYEPGRGQ